MQVKQINRKKENKTIIKSKQTQNLFMYKRPQGIK